MVMNRAGRVNLIQPNPDSATTVRDVILLNPSLLIEVVPYAVGAKDACAELVMMADTSMGRLSTSTFQHAASGQRSIQDIRTLDGLTATGQVPPPQLIKIDIEGAEFEALRGMGQTIREYRPVLRFVPLASSNGAATGWPNEGIHSVSCRGQCR